MCSSTQSRGPFACVLRAKAGRCLCPVWEYGAAQNGADQAKHLFTALRQLDERGAKRVFARCPAATGVALAVYNRLLRAAAFRVVEA